MRAHLEVPVGADVGAPERGLPDRLRGAGRPPRHSRCLGGVDGGGLVHRLKRESGKKRKSLRGRWGLTVHLGCVESFLCINVPRCWAAREPE